MDDTQMLPLLPEQGFVARLASTDLTAGLRK